MLNEKNYTEKNKESSKQRKIKSTPTSSFRLGENSETFSGTNKNDSKKKIKDTVHAERLRLFQENLDRQIVLKQFFHFQLFISLF